MSVGAVAWLVTALVLLAAPAAMAQADIPTLSGEARAINADIIAMGKQRIILWGIDAPERSQVCFAKSKKWNCYDPALRTLEELVKRGEVSCTFKGEPDRLNRPYGVCLVGGVDISAEMVRAGVALAYADQSDDYVEIQKEAIAAAVGLWQAVVKFDEPWKWRHGRSPAGLR